MPGRVPVQKQTFYVDLAYSGGKGEETELLNALSIKHIKSVCGGVPLSVMLAKVIWIDNLKNEKNYSKYKRHVCCIQMYLNAIEAER